jgi:iron complex transport system substrate-binding protein
MMITHAPEVKEQLESNGIPVIIDRSSYETHPLGRSEWIKLYGLLTDHLSEAVSAYNEQSKKVDEIISVVTAEGGSTDGQSGSTVAFFYVTSSGSVNVRKSTDYVASMIELAGGRYALQDSVDDGTATSSQTITMEEFYAAAKDADYLIYNSNIGGELNNVDDLIAKSKLFADFKAVKEGKVYSVSRDMYQQATEVGTLTADIYNMLHGYDSDMCFITKVN